MERRGHANGVITYTFDSFQGQALHAHVSTRHGGVSPSPWNSLNFSVKRGDTPERVRANWERLAEALGLAREHLVTCRQVHGTAVAKVDWNDAGQIQEGADALITDAPGLPLGLVFADCVPLVLYDPERRALGICHAGWRGTVNGAAVATLWAMQAAYGVAPASVLAAIGPSIGPASYQIGPEVADLVRLKLPQADELLAYPDGQEARPYLNLWQANVVQLQEAGVPPRQIEVSGIDTAQRTDDFFSHRAEQGRCGLFALIAWLDPES
ncbi:MAG TPA: peptidoglycan editing factor PgeF [Caldilineaceae bacterium]|nr:peptidoglycan editing factor PgeF [Caldilineaceae bacterium]